MKMSAFWMSWRIRSLPSGFEAFVLHAQDWSREVRCVLRVRERKRRQVVSDLLFTDSEGRRLGELRGLCMTLLRSREGVVQ